MGTKEQTPRTQGSILVLEDDDSLARLLGTVMAWTFERIAVCHDVDTALAEVQNREFDALVVDVGVGGKSGINFLRAARAAGTSAPAVITTGLVDTLLDADLRDLAVEAVLYKPYPLQQLEELLRNITRGASEIV